MFKMYSTILFSRMIRVCVLRREAAIVLPATQMYMYSADTSVIFRAIDLLYMYCICLCLMHAVALHFVALFQIKKKM